MELKKFLQTKGTKAKKPIDHKTFEKIPYFEEAFGNDKELWKALAEFAGGGGTAYIERKKFKPDEKIIIKGNYDQMLYWLISGSAIVLADFGGKPVKIYSCKIGELFGEAVITGEERRSDIIAGKQGAEVLEIDYSIADSSFELKASLNELLTMTLCQKLKNSYLTEEGMAEKIRKKISDKNCTIQDLQTQVNELMERLNQVRSLISQ